MSLDTTIPLRTGPPASLEELREQCRSLTPAGEAALPQVVVQDEVKAQPRSAWRDMLGSLEGFVRQHPKLSVVAAAGGGFLAGRATRADGSAAPPPTLGLRALGTMTAVGAGTVLGLHAALAHLPEVVASISSVLALPQGAVTGALYLGVTSLTVLGARKLLTLRKAEEVTKVAAASAPPGSIRVDALVARIMNRYDRNNDGTISLKGDDGSHFARDHSEKVVSNNTLVTTDTVRRDQISMGTLFTAAAEGGSKASAKAIRKLIASYDSDDSGWLEPEQLRRLKADHPEVRTSTTDRCRAGHTWKDPGSDSRFAVDKLSSVYDTEE